MTTIEEAKSRWRQVKDGFKKTRPNRIAYLGDGRGSATSNIIVTEDPTKVYARRSLNDTRFFTVTNRFIQPAFNKPVILGFVDHEPEIEQVLDYHSAGFPMETGVSGLRGSTAHHTQHEFGGGDEVFIDPRQFKAGLAKPTNPPSMQVHIGSFTHYYNEWTRSPEQDSVDLTSFLPATDSRYVLIALDADTNELVYRPGPIYVSAGGFGGDALIVSGGMGAIPAPAGNEYPIAAINLTSTTTKIDWSALINNIQDARLHISPPFKHIIDRLDQLEGTTGQNINLPVTGAQTNPTDDVLANAWALQGYQIVTTAPAAGSFLAWDINQNSWAPSGLPAGLGGEANTGVNLGTGIEVFREKSGANLNFRTLAPGAGVNIASATSIITITASAAGGETNTGENLGSGIGTFREKTGTTLLFKSLSPGNYTTLSSGTSEITIGSEAEPNTAVNLGTGFEVFREKSGVNLNFRTLIPGTNMTITSATSGITLTANAASGSADTAANLGTGIPIFREKSGTTLNFRTLVPGDGINISSATSTITVTASAAGSISDNSARVYHNANQEVNNSTFTSLSMNSERYDTDAFHDTGTNPTRFTIPTGLAGKYYISAHALWDANATGHRHLILEKNASVTIARTSAKIDAGAVSTGQTISTITDLEVGDYVEVRAWQNSGAGLSVLAGNATNQRERQDFVIQKVDNAASTPNERHFSFTIGASNTWNNELIPIWQAPRGSSTTIVEILATTSGTGADELNFNFQTRDYNAMQSGGIDIFAASQTATSATEQFTSFTRSLIDPRAHLMFTTGSGAETGSVNYVNFTIYYVV